MEQRKYGEQKKAPEVGAQEQIFKGVCPACGKVCKVPYHKSIVPKFCYYCGSKMDY